FRECTYRCGTGRIAQRDRRGGAAAKSIRPDFTTFPNLFSGTEHLMSLNDPNWGRGGGNRGPGGGNQGPPDLDELWRSFNRKLNELFGSKRPPGAEPPSRMPTGAQFGGGAGVIIA